MDVFSRCQCVAFTLLKPSFFNFARESTALDSMPHAGMFRHQVMLAGMVILLFMVVGTVQLCTTSRVECLSRQMVDVILGH